MPGRAGLSRVNKIRVLKWADRLLGRALIRALRSSQKQDCAGPPHVEKILVIRPGGIGDAVLLLPALTALKKKYPGARIDILCEKRNAGIFGLGEGLHTIYLYDRDMDLLRCIRNRYDAVIDTEQFHRLSAVAAYLTKARVRIGFDTNERRKIFTCRIPYRHDEYEVYSFFRLCEPLLGTMPDFDTEAPFIRLHKGFPAHLLPVPEKGGKGFVTIFPGATVKERRWGGENFGQVADALARNGYTTVVLGTQADREDARKVRKLVPQSIDLTGKTALKDAAQVLAHSRLLVTADSGMLHIAYGVGTPTVSLFGSGIEKKWAPPGRKNAVLNARLDCSPCTRFGYTPRCPKGNACLTSIRIKENRKACWAV